MVKFWSILVSAILLAVQMWGAQASVLGSAGNGTAINGIRFPLSESAMAQHAKETPDKESADNLAAAARFGFLSNSIYPGSYSTGTGQYSAGSPLKLDLGGLLIGGAIGLGLIFLIPKLFLSHGGAGCYHARNGDEWITGEDAVTSGAPHLLERLDRALAQHNIDSSSCAQRALCSYVQNTSNKVLNGSATTFDKILGDISSKASAENILGSSDYQRALDVARSRGDCAAAFPMCPSDTSKVIDVMKSFMGSLIL